MVCVWLIWRIFFYITPLLRFSCYGIITIPYSPSNAFKDFRIKSHFVEMIPSEHAVVFDRFIRFFYGYRADSHSEQMRGEHQQQKWCSVVSYDSTNVVDILLFDSPIPGSPPYPDRTVSGCSYDDDDESCRTSHRTTW